MSTENTWQNFCKNYLRIENLGFSLDTSKINFPQDFLTSFKPKFSAALSSMKKLEEGEIANPDEKRMVGHYWLRTPELAPSNEIKNAIQNSILEVQDFATAIHNDKIKGEKGRKFQNVVIIGIGGSALGPQLVSDALGTIDDELSIYFCDNTDPDGIQRLYLQLQHALDETLCIVVSKSGGTVETRNGMLEFENFYKNSGLKFSAHAVALTCEGSKLDNYSKENGWLKQFYMWDWVGGRTSIFCQVGLLPAALQGIDISGFLEGGRLMDECTREDDYQSNPALLLAAAWYFATDGKGKKDMVVLPYKDRLMLCSKYLQQLVMESIGKEKDLDGNIVHQGIAVYGNKGSTDQHAYVQQLREGVPNFFATFIEILKDYSQDTDINPLTVEDGEITSGDYLSGFFLGTRKALFENDRTSLTITFEELNARTLGALIALFDRAVGFYASFVNINAYHQPGVEAGKKAATKVIEIQKAITKHLNENRGKSFKATEVASALKLENETETIFKILSHLAANPAKGVKVEHKLDPINALFQLS